MTTFSQGRSIDPTDGTPDRVRAALQTMAAEGPTLLGPGLRWNRTERRLELDQTTDPILAGVLSSANFGTFTTVDARFEAIEPSVAFVANNLGLFTTIFNWWSGIQSAAASQEGASWGDNPVLPSSDRIRIFQGGSELTALAQLYPRRGASNNLIIGTGTGSSSNFNDVPNSPANVASWMPVLAAKVAEHEVILRSLLRDLKIGKDILK